MAKFFSLSTRCPVCLEQAAAPIYCCPEHHLLCESCLGRLASQSAGGTVPCPTCRTPLGRHRYRDAERRAEELSRLEEEVQGMAA